ncbi:MAG: HEPN domain-containing protein [Canidatus Methanoxibalbensis ujae]|nr:HEPN domain-containing protein [Candidatus Methanoxibalbensis ujae]MCW7077575.1 HEPN domain-containing protein [Candidatus Methanoxibalbensis ujae]
MSNKFIRHFIKTGKLDKELGKALRRAYDLRQRGDYETGFMVTEEEARKLLEIAKNFVKVVLDYLSERTDS